MVLQPHEEKLAISDTIAAILEREPEWKALPDTTPATVRRLLQRCQRVIN